MKKLLNSFILFLLLQTAQAQTASYEYDKLLRLTKATYTNGSTVTYQYDANGNRISHAVSITPGVAIDVTIQNALLVSPVVQQGGSLTLNGSEVNIGTSAAVAHYVRFFLSANNIFDANDVQLDQWLLNGLGAGANAAFNNRSILIPGQTAAGNYFLLVIADGGNNLAETNESNNITAIPFAVSTTTAILDPQAAQPIRINPNPANQLLILSGLGVNRQYSYSIIDYTGRLLLNSTIQNTTQQQINTSSLPAGTYLLRLYNAKTNKLLGTEKIIIIH